MPAKEHLIALRLSFIDTGKLIKNGNLDRETDHHVVLTVTATDNGVPSLKSSMEIYVEILDFNDNSPVFTPDSYSFIVPENVSVGYEVSHINATDADTGPNAEITYSILTADVPFTINETTVSCW